ncbi:hypothetical protein NDU88_005138 [Pleurodeles waltl]|uniref:Serine/threonine-protein kinase 31 n=1 Tax=Pleurodeles waltl TaxID=8319 RepID=A0AAV7KZU7_PLEWA|nr:hypothetical protein NDU88_005138 [Pleurodeles waltl]
MEECLGFGRVEQVFVSHVEDAVTFWAQCVDRADEMPPLCEELATYCPLKGPIFSNPEIGTIYGGLFSQDNCWYRCKVQKVISNEFCHVIYIDYGNSEAVNRSCLVELPEELQFPGLARKYRLWGLQLSDPDVSVSEQGTAFLVNMINERQITVRHKVTYKDNTVVVQAESDQTDIGEEVLKKGFAVRCKTVPILINDEGTRMDLICPPLNSNMSLSLSNRHVENAAGGDRKSSTTPNRTQDPFNNQSRALNPIDDSSGNNACWTKLSPGSSPNSLSTKHREVMDENERLKFQMDLVLKKCESLESQIELLGLEATKEKEAMHCLLERSLKTAISDKLRVLSSKIELLKSARRENMNICFGDDLSEAVRVISEECSVAPSSLETLEEIWGAYNVAQQAIQQCKVTEEVAGLIKTRNTVQQALFSAVQDFIREVDELSLSNRTKALEQIFSSLEDVYGKATDPEASDEVFQDFHDWKQAKIEKFSNVRSDTDDSLRVLFLWFNDLREFFDLTSTASLNSDEVVGNIDELIKNVESVIEKELNISGAEHDETEKKIILSAYNKVVQKIRQELELIRVVMSKHKDSVEFEKQIAEWLHKSPNVDKLLAIKKTLKGLKTQLRWKAIEQRSLEELDEACDADVNNIKENIAELREKIFEEIYLEQEEYNKLRCLVEKWFPELPLLHPESGIVNYMNSGGLLSVSLERELFNAEPMKELSSKRPVVCADIQGRKVLLKGYSIDVDTEAKVIERAAKYHMAWCELKEESHLVPLMFLFFCKSDPLAYLIVPFYPGESLREIQASRPLTIQEVARVMKGVACGLQTLHKANIVHGSVHQNNVFALNRKQGMLGDFDFTKTDEQRNLLNSVGPLNFTSPEVKAGHLASPSTDMYSYGCLLFWLSHGEQYKIMQDGTPDLESCSMDRNLKDLLSRLVSGASQITAAQVTEDEYFLTQEAQVLPVSNSEVDEASTNENADVQIQSCS